MNTLTTVVMLMCLAVPMQAQEKLHEKPAMHLVIKKAWLSILGGWDEEGRPVIKDLYFMTRWNSNLASLFFQAPFRIELKGASGRTENRGLVILEPSAGNRTRLWSGHIGIALHAPNPSEPFASFRLKGPGEKELEGKLEWAGPGDPALRIWEEAEGAFRWEVKDAWFVQVDATVNDGESWIQLGRGNAGKASLEKLLPQEPVVRIQAFRGLRCYVEIFTPGQGILPEPRRYLGPTYLEEPLNRNGNAQLSAWPDFWFEPSHVVFPPGFTTRVKRHLNWKRLPFDPEKVFAGKVVQDVMQAEWKPKAKLGPIAFTIDPIMLRDPERVKNMKFYRVFKDGEVWKTDFIMNLTRAHYSDEKVASPDNHFGSLQQVPLKREYETVNFDSYFVVVTDP